MKTLISSVRIRKDRAEKLRDKMFEIFKESKEMYSEADLINYLIDSVGSQIVYKNGRLAIKGMIGEEEKINNLKSGQTSVQKTNSKE